MITIYSANHRYKCLALALIVLGASSAFAISCLMSPGSSTVTTLESTPTPYPEQTWRINQSLTIGDFTVHLHQLRDTADGLRVVESYETTVSELNYLPIGSPGIQYANGTTDDAYGARLPSPGKDMNMSLGSFIVADTSLAGSVDIPLASVSESGELSPQPELLVGSRRYGVTKAVLWGDQLNISVQALNEAAKRSTLGVAAAAPVEAILTDNTGRTYNRFPSGSMEFDPFNQELTEQSFRFHGVQGEDLSSATKLILTIRGGGNIVGPFVFDNIALVSEGIPPVTPTPPEPTPLPMTHTQQVNRTLTIGEVTVELEEIRRSSDALAARYSYQVSDPNLEVDQMINGFDLIRADGSIDGLQTASRTDDGSEIVNFDLSTRIPELGENVSISLGSYIVAGPEISGSVTIPLSSEYATALSKESETNGPVRIPLQAEMSIGDRRYKVAEMLVFPQKFRLWVYPANEAARSTELGVIDPAATAILTDNTGASYKYMGGETAFDDLSPRGHKWRQFIFMGRVLPSVTSLRFSVKGGADIVGPFVFDDIALVSEGVPPVTPTPPEPTPLPMTHTQQINRTLTIGDITVELEQAIHSSYTLELRYSYYSTQTGEIIHPTINGHSLTRADGSVIDFPSSWSRTDDGDEISKFELSNPIPGGGETLDVSLGSYITPASTDTTGTALIEFAPNFGKAYDAALNAPGAVKPIDMPLQAELVVDERQYRVTKMTVFPISFQLEVVPVNEAGRKVELWGVDSSSEATLTDNTGASYYLEGGSTGFDDLSPRGHTSQKFIYQGVIPPSVSSLTLTVSGGGEIVGPFVFDNISLVSEDIPPVTPTPPGGVGPGDPVPTPPNVKD